MEETMSVSNVAVWLGAHESMRKLGRAERKKKRFLSFFLSECAG